MKYKTCPQCKKQMYSSYERTMNKCIYCGADIREEEAKEESLFAKGCINCVFWKAKSKRSIAGKCKVTSQKTQATDCCDLWQTIR